MRTAERVLNCACMMLRHRGAPCDRYAAIDNNAAGSAAGGDDVGLEMYAENLDFSGVSPDSGVNASATQGVVYAGIANTSTATNVGMYVAPHAHVHARAFAVSRVHARMWVWDRV